ncbi:MAG: hypothetical protein ACI9KK_002753 [Ascidiaceihabitans sp.]|jgi:hypothetical protein
MLAVFIAVVPMKTIAQDSNLVVQTFVKEHIMPRFVILKTFTKIWQKLLKLTYTMQVAWPRIKMGSSFSLAQTGCHMCLVSIKRTSSIQP